MLIKLEELVTAALQQAFPGVDERAMVTPCRDAKFGDYQCNNAMALFAKLKGKVQDTHTHTAPTFCNQKFQSYS